MYKWLSARLKWNPYGGKFLIILLLLNFSIAFTRTEQAEQVYYFSFEQLTENLENMQYNGTSNQYMTSAGTMSLSFDLEATRKGWRFLYMNFKTEGKPVISHIQFIDEKGKILGEQGVLLQNGENEIKIPVKNFQKIKLQIEGAKPFRFSLKNVELRRSQKQFLYKKFFFYIVMMFFPPSDVSSAVSIPLPH